MNHGREWEDEDEGGGGEGRGGRKSCTAQAGKAARSKTDNVIYYVLRKTVDFPAGGNLFLKDLPSRVPFSVFARFPPLGINKIGKSLFIRVSVFPSSPVGSISKDPEIDFLTAATTQ